jgi:hypothetical protein
MEFKSDRSADRECNDIFFILSLKLLDGDTNWPAPMYPAGRRGWALEEFARSDSQAGVVARLSLGSALR